MSTLGKVILGGVLAFFTIFTLVSIGSYVSAANYGNRAERQIEATWENNENILAQYSNRIGEMAQIPEMQRDDLLEVYRGTLEGRYGEDGSQAMFQWIQEQNPQIDSSVYVNIQTEMAAGRKDFEVAQTTLIDQKRSYETALGSVFQGFWLNIAGYPKLNLDDYKAISNTYASGAFESGIEDGIQLRQED